MSRYNATATGSRRRRWAVLVVSLLVGAAGIAALPHSQAGRAAQLSPTPVQLQFPTPTATPGPPSPTPSRTPTSEGQPFIEALSSETNVRAAPDINAERIGLIYPGTFYNVLGQRFDWLQIEFPNSPTGFGWVYNGVVKLSGDLALIPVLEAEQVPTFDPALLAAQQTAQAITATPGAVITLTAQAMITPTGVFTAAPDAAEPTLEPGAPLPTFTFPPATYTPVIIPASNPAPTQGQGGLPPLVPVLALAALGTLGLLVSLFRRL